MWPFKKNPDEQKKSQSLPRPLMSEDFQSFPHWAMVAFAARCARRAQIAIIAIANQISKEDEEQINRAISIAEQAAAIAKGPEIDLVLEGKMVSNIAEQLNSKMQDAESMIIYRGALSAALCAENALSLVRGANVHLAAATSSFCIVACGFHLTPGEPLPEVILYSVRNDYECLKKRNMAEHWTDNTPIAQEVFGPLWPNGKPEGWPKEII